jgi:superfamily II DNA or RNA helicase
LVPYDYYVHPVEMSSAEAAEWLELTRKLRKLGWIGQVDGPVDGRIQRLLIRRRSILERAAEKVDVLARLLSAGNVREIAYTLIYASDKGRDQLRSVNSLLARLRLRFYQLTFEETESPKVAASILRDFASGGLQILTAMRVLDEGVDIPQVREAFILASTTVERQWIQRRGRVLRIAPGKSKARIHDFLVVPPDADDSSTRQLLRSELARASEFAKLAANAAAPDGALAVTQGIIRKYLVASR